VGVEESHGVLVHTHLRDKDAAGGALLLAELASREALHGRTLIDTLQDALLQHGVFHNHTTSTVMKGAVGRSQINDIMVSYRTSPPSQIGNRRVIQWFDRQDIDGPWGPIRSETDKDSRNMLVYELEDNARIILRPSGTEPKAKIYVETMSPAQNLDQVATTRTRVAHDAKQIANAFCHEMLTRINISLPHWAMNINDMVSIQEKAHWTQEVIPQLLEKINEDPATAASWLTTQIDAPSRALLRPGVESMANEWDGNTEALLSCFQS
jgi:hypothetical protein